MKYAAAIILLALAFVLGWFLNAPPSETAPTLEAGKIMLAADKNDTPQWRAKVGSRTQKDVIEAIYEQSMPATLDEKIVLLHKLIKQSRKHGHNGNSQLQMQTMLLVMSLSKEELLQSIDLYLADDDEERNWGQGYLFRRLVELDREAALELFLSRKGEKRITSLGYQIFREWAVDDLNGALVALEQFDEAQRERYMNTMIYKLYKVYPEQALALQNTRASQNTYNYQNIFKNWARLDPAAAWQGMAQVPPGSAYENAMRGYFSELARQDRDLALAQANTLPNLSVRDNMLSTVYRQWMQEDVDAALESLTQLPHPQDYLNSWSLARDHPDKIMSWAQANLDGNDQDRVVSTVINALAQEDPALALAQLEALPYGDTYRRSLSTIASNWSRDDPEAALTWARSLTDGYDQRQAMRGIISNLGQNNPEMGFALYKELDERTRSDVSRQFVNNLVNNMDPLEVVAWAKSIEDTEQQADVISDIYSSWSRDDPEGLMKHLGQENFNALESNEQNTIMRGWADRSPAEAAKWLANVSEEQQTKLTGTISREWLDHDPYEASEWIASLPDGEPRQAAVINLVDATYRSDPYSALDWTVDITDDKTRYNKARRVVDDWAKTDPAAAWDALVHSELPEADVVKLQDRLEKVMNK